MKPEWKDAPEWANYLAMDDDGSWYWFEHMPLWEFDEWKIPGGGECVFAKPPQISGKYTITRRERLELTANKSIQKENDIAEKEVKTKEKKPKSLYTQKELAEARKELDDYLNYKAVIAK